ncbi:DUF1553 domain-containing protein [Anatilimnocola sp. NA78]|uniref:DUF1553 domain-containing protein n=1 Tax=Anatilimnocola sp. NA78 TaxID=3415683 RepID=UPI003CE4F88B
MNVFPLVLLLLAAEPATPRIDFATEIVPVLTKAGCNAGACHGAAAGRGGFHLSLFGSDATADHAAIVHAFEGRRVNLVNPQQSLLLRKPTGYLNHEGGEVLAEDGAGAKRITDWLAAGAPVGEARQLKSFDCSPQQHLAKQLLEEVPLRAMARFADDRPVDVSEWTVFTSADPSSLEIDPAQAIAKILRPGQHTIVARYLDQVVALQISLPLAAQPIDLSSAKRVNFIDEEVLRTLERLCIPTSPSADDATFLRRVTLDLTGKLPAPGEVTQYLADESHEKKTKLIDRLLTSEAFADYWTLRFAKLLNLHSLPNDQLGTKQYAAWLRDQIAADTPLNVWGEQLLTATGDAHVVGPANFGRMVADARGQAELVGRFFLGARLGCANCHHHPLDRWSQDDYHGLAAVFARLERGRQVQFVARGEVTNLRTGEPAIPRIPGVRNLDREGEDHRAVARWLTSRENPLFAKAMVNRLWQSMFGRGLVEPTDDLRATNPATHPELLEQLASDFASHRYSLRHTLRMIALSETYARSGQPVPSNATDDRFYSRSYRRPLSAEVLADAIDDVTDVRTSYANQRAGTRAVQLVDPLSPAPTLDLLGRCSRASCDEDAQISRGLPAQLHLLNGELVNGKLIDQRSRLQRMLAAKKSEREIVTEFYSRSLGREPTAGELKLWTKQLAGTSAAERREKCEDFVWSLLNSREFTENR